MRSRLPHHSGYFVQHLRTLSSLMRDAVVRSLHQSSIEELSMESGERSGDTIYRLDEHGEAVLLTYCQKWGQELPFRLVAEGLDIEAGTFPRGSLVKPAFTMIVDPVDGTRGLMYGKRSAWALFGIAPTPLSGQEPTLNEIEVALQAEIPTVRAALADTLWAVQGQGVEGETTDLRSGVRTQFIPRPSQAQSLQGGFATITKFFPGAKAAAAVLEEELYLELMGPPTTASPQVFDDEYISSGGQLYELMMGHDRFIADLRPVLHPSHERVARLCCHPYDVCTELIAR